MGIDIGTTSISAVLVDEQTGRNAASRTVNHRSFIEDGCPVGRTQDPERIIGMVMSVYGELTAKYGRPCCIGLTGQMHGMLYVDAQGRAVSPLYTWQDGRGGLPMANGMSAVERLEACGAGRTPVGYGLGTHLFHALNGQVPQDAAAMTTISDYLAMRLTGAAKPVLGADMAASWGGFDLERGAFRAEALEKAGADVRLLPRVERGYAIVGETPDGVPVMLSAGDNQASVIGAVRDMNGAALLNIGTGSQISMATERYVDTSGTVELRPCDRAYICAASGLCGGRAYAMLEGFYREVAGDGKDQYGRMLQQAEAFIAEHGVDAAWRVRTTFNGTRDDPSARGGIEGIGTDNFTPGAMTVGVILGILGELHEGYDVIRGLTGRAAGHLVGSGNGLRKNPLMRRLATETFGLDLRIPAHQEEAAYGATLCALAASGRVPSLAAAQKLIRYEDEV